MRTWWIILALALIPAVGLAQFDGFGVGVGGQQTILRGDGSSDHLNTLFVEASYSASLDSVGRNWVSLVSYFDQDRFAGAAVGYQYGVIPGTFYIGAAPGAFIFDAGTGPLTDATLYGGVEVNVSIWKSVRAGDVLPVRAFAGWYPISDRELGLEVWRFGVQTLTDLVSEE